MCGRFHLEEADDFILDARQQAQDTLDRLNRREVIAPGDVFPGGWAPALSLSRTGQKRFFPMLWGFHTGKLLINARSETADRLPIFAASFRDRRCLLPFSFYYEWAREGGEKVRYRIRPRAEGRFFLAGLYRFEEGDDLPRFTVLTRDAALSVRQIHPRMPVILPQSLTDAWLDRGQDGRQTLGAAEEDLTAHAG